LAHQEVINSRSRATGGFAHRREMAENAGLSTSTGRPTAA
jgi:hypothetical protein